MIFFMMYQDNLSINHFVDGQLNRPENRRLKWLKIWENEADSFRCLHRREDFEGLCLRLESEGNDNDNGQKRA